MTVAIPVMITSKMRSGLLDLNFTEGEIDKLSPSEAWEILGGTPEQTLPTTVENNSKEPDEPQEQITQPTANVSVGWLPVEEIVECFCRGEYGDAEVLASLHTGKIIYDHTEGQWYRFVGHRWEADRTRSVVGYVANHVAAQYLHAAANKRAESKDDLAKSLTAHANELRMKFKIANVLSLAVSLSSLALTGDEWDRDAWLLGVANGVIDLRTGKMRPGHPRDYIRRGSPAEWRGIDFPAPCWEKFLQDIFGNSTDLIGFIWRWFGYCITGSTRDHVLPILHGEEGRNGKGTMLEVLGQVVGDIALATNADSLMDININGAGPQPFVYDLHGRRMVWASESKEGRRLDEALAKRLTGGDTITVRTLHSKPVSFKPTHKIMLVTNRKPHIDPDDMATWERVKLIPFTQRFVDNPNPLDDNEHIRNPNIKDDLLKEAPGILAWLVRGCLEWQRTGLNPPQSVRLATETYRRDEDELNQFIQDECVIDPKAWVIAGDLYNAYSSWVSHMGGKAITKTAFGKRMSRKFHRDDAGAYRIYNGIGLMSKQASGNP